MPRSNAPLRVVKGSDGYDPRDPRQALAFLFAREAELAHQLAAVRAGLEEARKAFAGTRSDGGPQCPPRMERLRTLFGPNAEGGESC
jgi:hypothetical protein